MYFFYQTPGEKLFSCSVLVFPSEEESLTSESTLSRPTSRHDPSDTSRMAFTINSLVL